MKKALITIFLVLIAAGIGWFSIQNFLTSSSGIRELKAELQACSDSMDVLDMKIQDLFRKTSGAEGITVALDSLKRAQQALWHNYQAARKQIALWIEEKPSQKMTEAFSRLIDRLGPIYSAMGAAFFLVVLIGVILIKRAVGKNSAGQGALSRADHGKILTPSADDVPGRLQKGFHDNSAYSKYKSRDKGDSENGNIRAAVAGSGIQNEPDGSSEEVTVPVSHLGEHTPESMESKNRESSFNSAALEEDSVQAEKIFSADNDNKIEKDFTETRSNNGSEWERYEREKLQKAAVVKLARRGSTSSEIAKRLNISQDEVEIFIRDSRENG